MSEKKNLLFCVLASAVAHSLALFFVLSHPPEVDFRRSTTEAVRVTIAPPLRPAQAAVLPGVVEAEVVLDPLLSPPKKQRALPVLEALELEKVVEVSLEESLEVRESVGGGAEVLSYWEEVRRAVARKVRYPRSARRKRIEGTVYLRITLRPEGGLKQVEAVAPYADKVLTVAALRAVRSASPFPAPFFEGGECAVLQAEIPIRFQL